MKGKWEIQIYSYRDRYIHTQRQREKKVRGDMGRWEGEREEEKKESEIGGKMHRRLS